MFKITINSCNKSYKMSEKHQNSFILQDFHLKRVLYFVCLAVIIHLQGPVYTVHSEWTLHLKDLKSVSYFYDHMNIQSKTR